MDADFRSHAQQRPAIRGGAVDHEDLELVAADGNRFAAFAARASTPVGPGVVILPDVRGLHPFYEELALRFAGVGYDAIAFDYFGRTAGVAKRPEGFDYPPHVAQTTVAGISADVQACVDRLRQRTGQAQRNILTLGFCFGGGNSWIMASRTPLRSTPSGRACGGWPPRSGPSRVRR